MLGSSDADFTSSNKLHVTFHHNWFGHNVKKRMPSIRFGTVHLFNNYYHAPGDNYRIRIRLFTQSRIENNFFQEVKNPWEVYITDPTNAVGRIFATNNLELNTTWGNSTTNNRRGLTISLIVPGTDDVFKSPYPCTPDPAAAVPNLVTNFAGAGKGPFAAASSATGAAAELSSRHFRKSETKYNFEIAQFSRGGQRGTCGSDIT